MNIEKFNTALSIFIESLREFIPTTLGDLWPDEFINTLQKNRKKSWDAGIEQGLSDRDLLDFNNLEDFTRGNFNFWAPFWKSGEADLIESLKAIRGSRNKAAHTSPDLTFSQVESAFSHMNKILAALGQTLAALNIKTQAVSWKRTNEKISTPMKAVFKKNMGLTSCDLFMRITYHESRKDLQKYLQAPPPRERLFDGPMAPLINDRVEFYLKSVKLLDSAGNLTQEGKIVAQNGEASVKEEGKYQIWYCQKDELLGNRILFFNRQSAFGDRRPTTKSKHLPFSKNETQFCLSEKKGKDALSFSLIQTGNHNHTETLISEVHTQAKLTLRWEWNGTESSKLFIDQAGLRINKKEAADFPHQKLDVQIDLHPWITKLFPDWSFGSNRLPVKFGKNLKDTARTNFSSDYSFTRESGFDSIQFTRVPLMPANQDHAEKWRNWLIEKGLEKGYMVNTAIQDLFKETNSASAFSTFQLDTPQPVEFIIQHFDPQGAVNRGAAFWHLAAGFDLNPHL